MSTPAITHIYKMVYYTRGGYVELWVICPFCSKTHKHGSGCLDKIIPNKKQLKIVDFLNQVKAIKSFGRRCNHCIKTEHFGHYELIMPEYDIDILVNNKD